MAVRTSNTKGYITYVLLGIVVFAFLIASGFTNSINPEPDGTKYLITTPSPYAMHKSLELHTIPFVSVIPTPTDEIPPPETSDTPPPITGTYCAREGIKTPNCICVPTEKIWIFCPQSATFCSSSPKCPDNGNTLCSVKSWLPNTAPPQCYYTPNNSQYTKYLNDPSCTPYCIGKPVIYLYPESPLLVNVALNIPGTIVESIPTYPSDGWKNILANPDGSLIYEKEKYHELYYEDAVAKVNAPHNGILIASNNISNALWYITAKLGLLPSEQTEFLDYWVPKLTALHTPYILFSILPPSEKERIDHVTIVPTPKTTIQFLAYFKGIPSQVSVPPLVLPTESPKRIGFTSVEWGGVIDFTTNE